MRVVIALDAFKSSVDAADAGRALAAGWASVDHHADLDVIPLADGGEGSVAALGDVPGAVVHERRVCGPLDDQVLAQWIQWEAKGRVAVVELAQSSGIGLMPRPAPLDAHLEGLGEVMCAALDQGIDRVLVAVGGSASTDGGAGVLTALGARLLDAHGAPIARGGRGLADLASIDPEGLRRMPSGGVSVLSDVTNPLTGPDGAAAVYGPQKGASAADVRFLDDALSHFADVARRDLAGWSGGPLPSPREPRTGAAGGASFGLALWGASLTSGAAAIADAVGLDTALRGADLVITGEGRFDSQTAQGKVVEEVTTRAQAAGVPVALVAGLIEADVDGFVQSVALAELAGGADRSIAEPVRWLREAGAHLARCAC